MDLGSFEVDVEWTFDDGLVFLLERDAISRRRSWGGKFTQRLKLRRWPDQTKQVDICVYAFSGDRTTLFG